MSQASDASHMEVHFIEGESYEIAFRGHRVLVDQPEGAGGGDIAPTPTELLIVSLASCVAYYAGRYLTRHGYSRNGLAVTSTFDMATDRPARVGGVQITVKVPTDLPEDRRPALAAVVEHCTVHNTLRNAPEVSIELA